MALFVRIARGITQHTNPEIALSFVNGFGTSSTRCDKLWRARRGLTVNPNAYGVLTNAADYSFKDGRPTPLGIRLKKRVIKQREYAAKVVQLIGEIDFAVERYSEKQRAEAERRQQILDSKLKPKGQLLLQKK